MPRHAGNEGELLSQSTHDRLAQVRRDRAHRELREGHIGHANIPAGRIHPVPAVACDVETRGEPLRTSRESQAECGAAHAVVEDVALIAQRQPARVEPGVYLAQTPP